MARLQDKIALVSGAARGIGLAVARAYVAEGASVVLGDLRDEEGRAAAATLGSHARYLHLDVREEPDWLAAVGDIVGHHGRLDVYVNNAGITGLESGAVSGDPEQLTLEHWREVMATNLDGVMLGCKHGIPRHAEGGRGDHHQHLISLRDRWDARGGRLRRQQGRHRNHTKTVALWCARRVSRFRCNSVHPRAILTPMWEPLLGHGPDRDERETCAPWSPRRPFRRFGTPEEVAALCVHLAADESAYTTGSELHIDGGLLAGSAASPKG